jgi:hypothetical protein
VVGLAVFYVAHPKWTKIGHGHFHETFDKEWPPYCLIWAATKENIGV